MRLARPGLHKPVYQIDDRNVFPVPGCHSHEHIMFFVSDGLLDSRNSLFSGMVVGGIVDGIIPKSRFCGSSSILLTTIPLKHWVYGLRLSLLSGSRDIANPETK